MRTWRWMRGITTAVGVVALAASLSGCTPAQPTIVKSTWETATGGNLKRDGGYSAPLPNLPGLAGKSMWLWGDTVQNGAFIPGTFASLGPSTANPVPDVDEIPTPALGPTAEGPSIQPPPAGQPRRSIAWFLGLPGNDELRLPGSTPSNPRNCSEVDPTQDILQSLPNRWPMGLARGPGGGAQMTVGGHTFTAEHLMFIAYVDVCMILDGSTSPDSWYVTVQRHGIAVYEPAHNRLVVPPTTVFGQTVTGANTPWQQWLYHPTFVGSDVYFYGACNPDAEFAVCPEPTGKVIQAKAPFASILDGAAYQWKTATGWSSNPAAASTIVPVDATHQPHSIYVGNFGNVGRGWLMVEGVSGDGDVRIYQSASATGPWTLRGEGKFQGCPESPLELQCYHLWGHPELSTPENQIFSYHAHNPNNVDETYLISTGTLIPPL